MTGLQLQPAGPTHSEVLAHLHRQCFYQEWRACAFVELLNSPGCFALLAVAHDRPAGFALARVTLDEGEILSLGVLPRQREKGVGHFLLAGVTAYVARNGGVRLFLEVSEKNHPARMLYGKAGFHDVGKRRNYYIGQDGKAETAIIMRRELAG